MKEKNKYVLANEQWERDINRFSYTVWTIAALVAAWKLFF